MYLYANISFCSEFFFNISNGLQGLPASVNILISLEGMFHDIDIKTFINPFLLYAFNNLVINIGSPVYPNKVPFNNTFVISLLINKLNLFKGIIPISNKHLLILSTFIPAVILVNNDKFFRYPIEAPSGLSKGHIIPHCCECNL